MMSFQNEASLILDLPVFRIVTHLFFHRSSPTVRLLLYGLTGSLTTNLVMGSRPEGVPQDSVEPHCERDFRLKRGILIVILFACRSTY